MFFTSQLIICFHQSIQTLTTLDVEENRIGNVGAQYLVDVLQNNTVKILISYLFILYSFNVYTDYIGSQMQSNREKY
jgi:hypothetical protein